MGPHLQSNSIITLKSITPSLTAAPARHLQYIITNGHGLLGKAGAIKYPRGSLVTSSGISITCSQMLSMVVR